MQNVCIGGFYLCLSGLKTVVLRIAILCAPREGSKPCFDAGAGTMRFRRVINTYDYD